jgi:hypothetical protein
MVTQESLKEQYAKFDNIELLEITANKKGYTELAISVALTELKKRGIPNDEIRNYKSVLPQQPDELLVKNYLADLNLFQRSFFIFFGSRQLGIISLRISSPVGMCLNINNRIIIQYLGLYLHFFPF